MKLMNLWYWTLISCFVVAGTRAEEPISPLISHVESHRDGKVAHSIDFAALAGDKRDLPIGVFDSGIGGLTVLEAILTADSFNNQTLQPDADGVPDFSGERFIYLGDQANMPYGNYPAKGHEDFLRELIVKDAVFLLGRRYFTAPGGEVRFDKPPVKAIVIACNTATAYGIEDIRAALKKWGLEVPVIGVVEAGARAVNESLPDSGGSTVAVLATVGTCSCEAYPKAIGRAMGLAGKSPVKVIQQGCVSLAGAIEGQPELITKEPSPAWNYRGPAMGNTEAPIDATLAGAYGFDFAHVAGDPKLPETWRLNSVGNYVRYEVTSLLENYRRSGGGTPVTAVVLGCTHFPLVQREILRAFETARNYENAGGTRPYAAFVADRLNFINPAELTAKELFRELARARLRVKTEGNEVSRTQCQFFLSVPSTSTASVKLAADGSLDFEYKYSRPAGKIGIEDTVMVPMSKSNLPAASTALIRALPAVSIQISQ